MSHETGDTSTTEDFWELPDDIYVNMIRKSHEAESEKQDGLPDSPERFDETLTSSDNFEASPIWMHVPRTLRLEDYPEGVESITEESLCECFPFQMDKNNIISCERFKGEDIIDGCFSYQMDFGQLNSSYKPCDTAVKDNYALLGSHVDESQTARVNNKDGAPVGCNGEPRHQLDYKACRIQLFNAIFEGDLDTIDTLLGKVKESNGYLSHQILKDPNTGQTCLMKALLKITNKVEDAAQDCKTVEIVKKLISFSRKTGDLEAFINAAYTDKIYRGQTSLHIAVERRRCDLVKLLVRNGAAVDAMAKGSFFRNKKHKKCSFYFGRELHRVTMGRRSHWVARSHDSSVTSVPSPAGEDPSGGFPLSLAACTNQLDIVTFLIEHGADPRAQDRAGNTVLHALVTIAYDTVEARSFVTEMYDFILMRSTDISPSENLEKITNLQGLTPLHLAAQTGKIGIFKHILGREIKQKKYKHLSRKFTEWEYGPVSCSLYDLSGVDTIEENSVLQTVVYSSRNRNRHEMLSVEPMNELLQKKWEDFGVYLFIGSFIFYLTYIITLTIVASNREERNNPLDQEQCSHHIGFLIPISAWSYLPKLFQAQIYLFLMAVYLSVKEASQMVYLRRSNLHSVLMDGFFHVLYFLQAILVIIFNSLCWAEVEGSRILLVIALALGWFNVLYYTRGFKLTGIYCVMIKKIILQDILRFLLVYAVFIVGFAAALASLIEECPPDSDCPYNGFSSAILELFKLTIGLGDLGIQKHSRFPIFFHMLLVLYVILTFVLLLNMLIALMGETVTKISSDSEKIWKLQRAETTLHFERSLPKWLRTRCKNGHSFTEITVGLTPEGKEDKRWCLRLNEVNWNEWDTLIGTVTESLEEE
ncbi:transient receptor potential cation channel subfamily V member 3-like isoform X2 [Hemiscyllium ocellatum]|uniref:transient receptor potential cation channel subfamily V member 3-like isoform X2 n=1 Tax=Hemiscyllium ocellatum TaxID=170820 RepID=UPI00296704C7|nr:transient receptor potential cation channel subfamily V member 3-like isoform X2 [Hemiscyllium ocellatum]